ncbi:hypothetical protein DPMN_111518 [Dreissena polymorpha]|uniref:Uncharacterized protein n=1 Tax=Dreissena polymorpha TaxID=45954 RepID=A0A9D4QPV4_DREPO|nr:hypothetical protein DPMN_111518 [Dreissena polymorpha]
MWTDRQRTKTNPKTSAEQSEINKTNVLTKITRKTVPTPWQPYINKTNLFTKFHDDCAKNVTSRVQGTKLSQNQPASQPASPPAFANLITTMFFQLTGTIFQLNSRIKETNVLTKFHENWAKNMSSRVFTSFHCIHIQKNSPPTGGHVFSPIWTIFELVRHINKTNVLINFHDWAKIVTSRVFTRKTAPPTGDWALNVTSTVFKLDGDFIGTKLLSKFHEDLTINVASRVFTNKYEGQRPVTKAHLSNQHIPSCHVIVSVKKNAPPTGGHVFQATGTIFELVQNIIGTNLLTKFHDERTINTASRVLTRKNATPPWRPCFCTNGTIFKLIQDIVGTNHLTKFHDDLTINVASRVLTRKNAPHGGHKINVASRVLTRFYYSHIWKNAPPHSGHVFQPTGIIF